MSNAKILAESAALQPTALVSFFILDATVLGGDILRLTPLQNGYANDIVWQGVTYSGFPIEFQGNMFRGQGTIPRPAVRLANVAGTISSLCIEFGDLVGATFTRKRTFSKFLDGMPDADPTAALPDEIFEIDRKANEDRDQVEFELAAAMEVEGVVLPRRQVMGSQCSWIYRSPECGFAEDRAVANKDNVVINSSQNFRDDVAPYFDGRWEEAATYAFHDVVWRQITPRVRRFFFAKDVGGNTGQQPPHLTYWAEDLCSLTPDGCRLRYPPPKALPFGGFPGTHKLQGS